jgi:hypothetical protein
MNHRGAVAFPAEVHAGARRIATGGTRLPADLATAKMPRPGTTGGLSGLGRPVTGPDDYPAKEASGPVNRFFRLLAQRNPATRTGFMIADAVRYMSVHS